MADISAKLVELSADRLRDLHKRLHLLKSTSANIEAHHLTTIEMRRRGMEIGYDKWDQYEILVDTLKQADLRKLGAFEDAMIEDVIKETGSSAADVQTVLTSKGYEMRLEPVEKVIRQYKGKWTVYNADETKSFGTYNTRIEAEARLKQMHQFKKHNQGQHDQKTHGKWADNIADQINNGKHPSIEAENVTAFLMGAAKRTDHPDLTELKVNGTMLFGDEGKGIARKDMPQIPAERRGEFLADLEAEGVTVKEEAVDPKTLKPIQKEVSASRSGAIYNNYKEQGGIPQEQRILISKDGFVIDGHHTWGAAVGFSFDNKDAKLPVYRLSLNADEALARSLEWTKEQGIEGQAIDAKAPTKKSLAWQPLSKHGGHADQKVHGSWANGVTSAIVEERRQLMARGEAPGLARDENGRVINPHATGGYLANIPEKVTIGGTEFTPEHSLWHHIVQLPDGTYGLSEQRRQLHEKIIKEAVEGVPESADPTFYMLGGGPASGKTSAIKAGAARVPGKGEAVQINADDIKESLPENERMRFSVSNGDFFNAASFVHEESSMLAKRVQSAAIRGGKDIVLDGTGDSSIDKLEKKVQEATGNGYKVNGIYITVPTDVAVTRSNNRSLGSERRYVPTAIVETTHADISRTFPKAIERGLFNKVELFENTNGPVLIGSGSGTSFTVANQKLYDDFLDKGK